MSFWEVVWLWFGVALAVYLFVVVALIVDLFRDPRASGSVRAAWTLYLVCLPVLAVIVYLVVRGRDVGARPIRAAQPVTRATSRLDERPVGGGVYEPVRGRPLP